MGTSSAVELRVLGVPEVLVDGHPVAFETRKALAVLARLAIDGPQRREALDALLWPSSDSRRARQSLRRTLSALRKGLGDDVLSDADDVTLAIPVHTDLDVLEAAATGTGVNQGRGGLDLATAAVRGPFLDGLHFRDAEPFDHWVDVVGERVRRLHARLLERRCTAEVEDGDLVAAVESARDRLDLDPLHEPSYRQLMVLHAWMGDRSAATRAFDECVRVLDEELGVAPMERTAALERALRAGRVPSRPSTAPPRRDATLSAPTSPQPTLDRGDDRRSPLVGRESELAILDAVRRRAARRPAVAIVQGEAGIGKTRLVEEVVATARAEGTPVVVATAQAAEAGLAYAPVMALVRSLADRLDGLPTATRSEIARLAPDLVDVPAPAEALTTPAARTRFVESCAETIRVAVTPEGRPGVLVLEDLDRGDGETRELVAYLLRRLGDRPLLIVLTWRDPPTSVMDAAGDASGTTIDLPRLGPDEVAELARAMDAERAASRLFRESEGVPYLVISYLAARHRPDAEDWPLPADGVELVRTRLDPLDEVAVQVLAAAAVLGVASSADLLIQVSGRGEDEVVEALDQLAKAGLLAEDEVGGPAGPTFRFTHDKIRTVVEQDTSRARRRLLHRRAAEALARAPQPPPAATLARHLEGAGLEAQAAQAHARAGRRAADLYANEVARQHLEAALALGHRDDAGALLLELGDVHLRLGHHDRAADHWTRSTARGCPRHLVDLRRGALALRRGDPAEAEAHLVDALEAARDADARVLVRIEVELAHARLRLGDQESAGAGTRRALEAAEAVGGEPLARACNLAGLVARRRNDPRAAESVLHRGLEVAVTPEAEVALRNNLALALLERGEVQEAVAHSERALEDGRLLGDRHWEAALTSNLADALHSVGRTDEALELQAQAAERFVGVGDALATPQIWQLVDW